MGIYAPGITKPDHCCNCQFCEDLTDDCLLQNDAHWSTYSEQIKNCPLIEIHEPHGDLIDRDALNIGEYEREDDDTGTLEISLGGLLDLYHKVKDAPTVIEAEGVRTNEFIYKRT